MDRSIENRIDQRGAVACGTSRRPKAVRRSARVVAAASVDLDLSAVELDLDPMPFSNGSNIGRVIPDDVLVAENLARFDGRLHRLGLIFYAKVKATGFLGKLLEQFRPLPFGSLIARLADHTGTKRNRTGGPAGRARVKDDGV